MLGRAYAVVDKSISTCQSPCATIAINRGQSMPMWIIQKDTAIHVENPHRSVTPDRCVELATKGRVELPGHLARWAPPPNRFEKWILPGQT